MSDITLLEAAKHSQDALEKGVTKLIVESSPILEYVPIKTINGPAYRYYREASLGTVAFRGVGGTYTPDAGVINPQMEPLVILGGEVKVDNFEVAVMSNLIDLKSSKYRMKSRQMGIQYSTSFFEGDTATDPYAFDGLRKRATGNQKILAATGGGTLTLAMLDQLLDAVVGDNSDKALFMNVTMRRKITALARAQTGTVRLNQVPDAFNKQQEAYASCPLRVIQREDDASTIFGFDEDPGDAVSDCTSIYCVRFGIDYVHGISDRALPNVKDFGEVQAGPYHLGRIEWYTGLVAKHPRGFARLYGLTNT